MVNIYQAYIRDKSKNIAIKLEPKYDKYTNSKLYFAKNYIKKTFAGFIKIELSCIYYNKTFLSKTILHKYLKICFCWLLIFILFIAKSQYNTLIVEFTTLFMKLKYNLDFEKRTI